MINNIRVRVSGILTLVFVFLLFLTGCKTTQKDVDGYALKTVQFDGNEMECVVFGEGEKSFVILPGLSIHSVMGLGEAVAESYSLFTSEYTVYLFDRSKKIEDGTTIQMLASDTASAMKALGIEKADIYGISQGGMIALCLALDYPELCDRVVLSSTLARTNDTFKGVIEKWIEAAENKDEEGLLLSFIEDVYSEETVSSYGDILLEANRGISGEEYRRFITLAESCLDFDVYDELNDITSPVLVLGAEGDKVVTLKGVEEIADKMNCTLYIYPVGYGHAVYDEAGDIKERILEFLGVR